LAQCRGRAMEGKKKVLTRKETSNELKEASSVIMRRKNVRSPVSSSTRWAYPSRGKEGGVFLSEC